MHAQIDKICAEQLEKDDDCYLWWAKEKIERFLVVHGQVILGQLADHPRAEVKKCALVKQIEQKMSACRLTWVRSWR